MKTERDPYEVYVEAYGRVRSGHVLDRFDFYDRSGDGPREFDLRAKTAIAIASQDHAGEQPLRSRDALNAELLRLLGPVGSSGG